MYNSIQLDRWLGYSFRQQRIWVRAVGLCLLGAWFSSWYFVSIDTGQEAQSSQSGPRGSPAFKIEPVLSVSSFTEMLEYWVRLLSRHPCAPSAFPPPLSLPTRPLTPMLRSGSCGKFYHWTMSQYVLSISLYPCTQDLAGHIFLEA